MTKGDKPSYKDKLLAADGQDKALTKGKDQPVPKGCISSPSSSSADWSRSSSSSSSSPQPPPQKRGKTEEKPVLEMKNTKKIAVDWHGVLVTGYGDHTTYDRDNTKWLQALKDHGYEVNLVSYCGVERSREVEKWAWHEWQGWASVSFTWTKTGQKGKAQWCLSHDVTKMVDDNLAICQDCIDNGVKAYPVLDIRMRRKKGEAKLQSWFRDFGSVVQEILKEEEAALTKSS